MRLVRRGDRRIAYRVIEGGPARLVLVSGTGLPGAYWTLSQTGQFREWATCLLVDNAGCGSTEPLQTGAWTTAQMAGDLIAVLDDAGWDRAHVAGHSLGSAVCVQLAHLEPERVRSLSLNSTWPGTDRAPHLEAWLEARQATARIADPALWMRYAFFLVGPAHFREHGFTGGALAAVSELVATMGSTAHIGQYDAGLGYRADAILPAIAAPTLVTAGQWDLVTLAEYGRAVAATVPGARFHEFADAGHLSGLEAPEEFNAVQRQFIESVGT
jgi:pimeloyl-ACP methyl ester carboxylesterase